MNCLTIGMKMLEPMQHSMMQLSVKAREMFDGCRYMQFWVPSILGGGGRRLITLPARVVSDHAEVDLAIIVNFLVANSTAGLSCKILAD